MSFHFPRRSILKVFQQCELFSFFVYLLDFILKSLWCWTFLCWEVFFFCFQIWLKVYYDFNKVAEFCWSHSVVQPGLKFMQFLCLSAMDVEIWSPNQSWLLICWDSLFLPVYFSRLCISARLAISVSLACQME